MKLKYLLATVVMICTTLASCSDSDESNESKKVDITATEVTNLTPDFIGTISGIEQGEKFNPGDSITLTLTPGEILMGEFADYHMEHIHVHVGDKVYMPEFPAGAEGNVQQVTLKVPVPSKPFAVVVAYAVQQKLAADGHTLLLENQEEGIELFGVSAEKKYQYFDCYLRTPEAYTIDKVEYKMGDSDWQDLSATEGCYFERSTVNNVYKVTVRPNYQDVTADVTLRINGTQHKRCKITWKNTEFINTEVPEGYEPNILPESAIGGDKVVASFYTKDDYYLAGATANIDGVVPECKSRAYVVFTMPEQDVEITLDFKEKIAVESELGAHIKNAQVYTDKDIYYGVPTEKAIPGEYVYLFANADNGFKPSVAINNKGERAPFVIYGEGLDRYGYYAQVHVPEDASKLTIKAEAVAAHRADGANIVFEGGHYYAAGETVHFSVAVPSGKKIKSVSAADSKGSNVPVTMDGAYGSFTMPDANVTVSVTFEDVNSGANVTIKAFYDDEEYRVTSQSQAYYGAIDSEGIQVATGTTLYISVSDDYGEAFWVGVKIGDSIQYFEAQEDEDSGEYTFGRSFEFNANAVIKVGPTKNAVTF